MPDFEWSPEAIEWTYDALEAAVTAWLGGSGVYRGRMRQALDAAVKVQPVVALPPCPTCEGQKKVHQVGVPGYEPERHVKCSACNGSGVERLVPVSEIVAWSAKAREWMPDKASPAFLLGAAAVLDGLDDAIERGFGGRDE